MLNHHKTTHTMQTSMCDIDSIVANDIQSLICEMLSSVEQHNKDPMINPKRKSKCHGNRKLQHFKKKCREQGLTEEEITELIHSRNQITPKVLSIQHPVNNQMKSFNKRKRHSSNSTE